ncbi:MAG: 2-hydroxyacyl-CoA dehydratase [Chloroflexi bacterium]|nr:2-hydroxyacyl-CoA dehydratase [Chloroflexota bacterium]
MNTLKALEVMREAIRQRPQELSRARRSGQQVVGYLCCYTPEEIIDALGLIPLRICRGGNEEWMEVGAQYTSTKNCAYVREVVGMFVDGKDPLLANSDFIALTTADLEMGRVAEVISYYCKIAPIVLDMPRSLDNASEKEYLLESIKDFTAELERRSGKKLDQGRLREAVALYGAIRKCLLELYELQAGERPPLSWREVFEVTQAGFYLDRRRYLTLLGDLLKEVRYESRDTGIDNRPRILLCGSIIAPGDNKLLDLIDDLGGRIVGDDLCTGRRFYQDLEVKEPSLRGIAEAYADRLPSAHIVCLRPFDEDRRFINVVNLARSYRAGGIIYHSLRFCDPFSFKALPLRDFLRQKLGNFPFLTIHTEYSSSDVEALRTRVESFLNVVASRRVRREAVESGRGQAGRP